MHLPTLASTLLLPRADPLANQPDWSKDKFPPYPSMTNPDGTNITVENLRGTRLFGWKGCEVEETKIIAEAFDDFYKLAQPLSSGIDWASEVAEDFWGKNEGPNRVPDDRRKQILQIFQAQQQMYAIGWHLLPPYWTSLWIEVACSGGDGTGDPENICRDQKPNNGRCGRGGQPQGRSGNNALQAFASPTSRNPENWYSKLTFCNGFFNLPALNDVMKMKHKEPMQLESWDNRARVFLHEVSHLDYFMNSPGSSPVIDDLQFTWREGGKIKRGWVYGPKLAKMLRNYGQRGLTAFYPQRNAENFAWFSMGSYVQQVTGTYPRRPRPNIFPITDPRNGEGGDVKAADSNPAFHSEQPPEDRVKDSDEEFYEYAEGFTMPNCPDLDGDSVPDPQSPAPPPAAPPATPPPTPKTNALSIIFQISLDEIGTGYDWLFLPGKQGETKLCHDQKEGWHFTSEAGTGEDGIQPWPVGTYHFDNLLGRSCDYKNDGKDNAGMLWCKEKDGLQDVGISCQADGMRTSKTTKPCTQAGLIPSVEHVTIAYCEW